MRKYLFTDYNADLVSLSKTLRKNMTPQERHLWYDFLRDYPIKFYRQRPIGNYIADFYCSDAKLVIELDGRQHYTDEGRTYDELRTSAINYFGIGVIRFTNRDIDTKFKSVCIFIDTEIKKHLQ